MFCSECGAKNKKNAAFCEECGAKLEPIEEEKTQVTKAPKKKKGNKKKLSKKQIILISAVVVVVVALFIGYQVLSSMSSPQKVVENYIEAINKKDYSALYDYANFSGDTTFINEKAYTNAVKDLLEDASSISNFTVGRTAYENGGLTAVVTINAAVKLGTTTSDASIEIRLTKEKEKQFLFFPKWTITDDELLGIETVTDFELEVPKDTKVTFAGVEVTDKYLDKNDEEDYTETYILPQVLTTKTETEFILPGDLEIKKDIVPSSYTNRYSLNVLEEDFTKAAKEKLTETINNTLSATMKGLIDNKTFEDIKQNYANDESSDYLEDFKDEYEDYKENLGRDYYDSLTEFNIEDISISSIGFTSDYELNVRIRLEYNWKQTDKETGEVESDDTYNYYSFYLVPEEDTYKVVGMSSLPSTVSLWW